MASRPRTIGPALALDIELEWRRRKEREALGPRYDWFGPPCGCPAYDAAKGRCPDHPRARPKQRPPEGDWHILFYLGGRGAGKTRGSAEIVRHMVESGAWGRVALVGSTASEVRDVMIEGESGLLAISPPWFRPVYMPSKARVEWPNGAIGTIFTAEEPGKLRGPQHHGGWADELSKWPNQQETWDNLELGLRLGDKPRVLVSTTPQPTRLVKSLLRDPKTVVVTESTYANVDNLAESFRARILSKFEGTRLGKQELHAELLEDTPGALWTTDLLEANRVDRLPDGVELVRIVVGVDPAGSIAEMARLALGASPRGVAARLREPGEGDEAGIVVAGLGDDGRSYVLGDFSTLGSPHAWGLAAAEAYGRFKADRVVAEQNHGGETVREVIEAVARQRGEAIAYRRVWASRGKYTRAEPIAALYEQGKVSHVGVFPKLEDELCEWVPGMASPNRLDALVWALHELMGGAGSVEVEEAPEWLNRRF